MRLVLDTNTVISGLLWHNKPAALIHAALEGRISLFTSAELLLELEDVLPRQNLKQRVTASRLSAAQLAARYAMLAKSIQPALITPVITNDPDDDHVLACALAAQANLIVSGDSDLLNLKRYQGIEILTAAAALVRVNATAAER